VQFKAKEVVIAVKRIGLIVNNLMAVLDTTLVCIRVKRVGLMSIDLGTVLETVKIRVWIQWIGLVCKNLFSILDAITICVGIIGISTDLKFTIICKTIAISIYGAVNCYKIRVRKGACTPVPNNAGINGIVELCILKIEKKAEVRAESP
jgi:hypothetical protein